MGVFGKIERIDKETRANQDNSEGNKICEVPWAIL